MAVELRYAQRLHSLTESSYDLISAQDADAIYQTHRGAMALLRALGDRDEAWWQTPVQFVARNGGTMRATRRTVMLHALLHSIRHYAQLATIARRAGIAPGWSMDYLSMELLPVSAA